MTVLLVSAMAFGMGLLLLVIQLIGTCGTSYQWHFSKICSPAYRLEMLEYTSGTQELESIRDF